MVNIHELVKAKNMDLLMHRYNNEVTAINKLGILEADESEVKKLKNNYENLMARLDTDKNTTKTGGQYKYNIPIGTKQLIGLKGMKTTINIGGVNG